MRKHRRKTHYRKMTIAAVALGAVAVPSVAMACLDPREGRESQGGREHQGDWGTQANPAHKESRDGRSWGDWRNAPDETARQRGGWDGQSKQGGEPAGEQPGANPGIAEPDGSAPALQSPAPAAPKTPAPKTPAPKTPAPAAPKPAASSSAPAPTAPGSSAPGSGAVAVAVARVVQLVNSERGKAGCSPLTVNATLAKAAQGHSEDMAAHRNMSHSGSDGSDPGTRITRAGYRWSTYGENVAYGYETPEQVMAGWMSSPGHKKNILNCEFKEIGVGLAQPGNYWTQSFGTAR
ncbi:CAP domain-containing protein [Streptomyces pacificus]|uniref:CAP domain-containing protein n=1 Tax=Streptomyces pacificus TaxID=2705029 RepID=A0A6A0B2Q0_9ACTN|nr:CAP domain-containing protein [Streptomyces pacificus]GFH38821.1 CAP domain-containing protein [Streptomyces pacificus]